MSRQRTIIVCASVAKTPRQGGLAWVLLQYLLGLRRLEYDVYFVEPIASEVLTPHDTRFEESENAAFFRRLVSDFGFEHRAALLLNGSSTTVGLSYDDVRRVARRAELLLNISGLPIDEELVEGIPIRAYLDVDPAFTQMWHAVQGVDMRFDRHTHFATIGLAIGKPQCPVPTCGFDWITAPQPIVLEYWPVAPASQIRTDALTTVANWRGYGSIEHDGVLYGQKCHSLRRFIDLPRRSRHRFELALSIHPEERNDLAALRENGWELVDPELTCRTPHQYQAFVRESKGELGIAKSGYVASRCAWFSDRSLCYLASGRPVIAQDTGFGDFLPVGSGLMSFETADEAAGAVVSLHADYAKHARAARGIAEEYFDSDKVLPALLRRLEVARV